MKENYKGYEIDVKREVTLGAWNALYFSVFRISDGLEIVSDFTDGEERKKNIFNT